MGLVGRGVAREDGVHVIDPTNWAILRILQRNARVTFSELGRRVGLSPPAVAERVRRLEDAGVIIGYRVDLDLEEVGFPVEAVISLRALTAAMAARFEADVQRMPAVVQCDRVTGEEAFVVRVATRSVPHLETVLRQVERYGKTTTSIVLSKPVPLRPVDETALLASGAPASLARS